MLAFHKLYPKGNSFFLQLCKHFLSHSPLNICEIQPPFTVLSLTFVRLMHCYQSHPEIPVMSYPRDSHISCSYLHLGSGPHLSASLTSLRCPLACTQVPGECWIDLAKQERRWTSSTCGNREFQVWSIYIVFCHVQIHRLKEEDSDFYYRF